MGFSSASGSVEQKSWFDRYVEDKDNIKDIKSDLSKLKKDITLTNKVNSVETKMGDDEYTREKAINDLDKEAEHIFDDYIIKNETKIKELILADNMAELKKLFNEEIWNNIDAGFTKTKDLLIKEGIEPFQFELNDLATDIKQELGQQKTNTGNVFLSDIPSEQNQESNTTSFEQTEVGYHAEQDYIERFDSRYYGGDISYERYNIYRDSKTKKILEELFDDETIKEIKKGMFNINLDKEDGLAGIIISLRDIMPSLKDYNPDTATPEEKAKLGAYRNIVKYDNGVWKIQPDQKIIKENLNILIDNGSLSYTKESGLLTTELSKIAKILSRSSRETLDTFASLAQSKDDMDMFLRERYNAGAMTGTLRDDKDKNTYKEFNEGAERQNSIITPDNVLYFLCDYNSDLTLSAEYEKRNNLKQQDQGDVGSIFGQQLMFTFEQAIALQNLEHPGEGEQRVIHNILKNIQISDRRLPSAQREKFIQDMIDDTTQCTKENLTKLINGYYDEEKKFVEGMPEFKIFFLDSIKKINGGSDTITPDLYDTLIGEDADNLMDMYKNNTEELNNRLEQILVQSQDPAIKTLIEQQGIVRVRNTLVGKIIEYMNNVTITLNDGTLTNLAAAGIGKDREIDKARNEVLETVMSYISTGLHYNKKEGYRLTVGTGDSGISGTGRTKRNRGAEAGVIIGKTFDLYLGLDGEILEQTNHRKVINANLSDVRKAQYVGLEGGAGASFKGIELFGGVTREQDPAMGINQIDEQYEEVSRKIFDISSINADILSSKEALSNYLQQKITSEKYGPYQAFIDTNTQHLEDNLSFIIRYMDARGFFGTDGKIAQLPIHQRKEAVGELITLLQSGNREERRHNVIAGLHGHIEITKLSFGVTTSKLTLGTGPRGVGAESNSGHTVEGLDEETQAGNGNDESTGVDKFGIAGYYIGMRLSTWKNKYVPRAQQYLYTQYEIGQGVDTHSLEHKNNLTEDINYQADYLKAVFNSPYLTFTTTDTKITISFNHPDPDMSLAKYLNIHATDEATEKFSLSKTQLIIGSVGPIGAYTVTSGNGVRRILSLGTEKVDEAKRIAVEQEMSHSVGAIEAQITSYEALNKTQIDTIIDNMGNDEAETDSKRFFDEEGKLITPSGEKVDYVGCKSGDTLKHGTLTITKKIDGRYSVKYTSSSVEKLTITYIDMKEYQVRLDDPDSRTLEKSISTDNLFTPEAGSEIANAQKYLDTLTKDIYNIEHTNPEQEALYGKFMTSASAIIDGATIDDKELSDAIGYLQKLLPDTSNVDQLKGYLVSSDRYTKSYVVDRLKQIFAKEDWYTEGKLLSNIIFNGRTGRKTITGPSGKTLDPELIQTFDIQKNIWQNETYEKNPQIHKNLIGYTAFYRTYGGIQQTKNYSITSLGTTSSQVDLYVTEGYQREMAKPWFMNNFKNNEKEVEYFATQIEKKCAKEGISVTLKASNYKETRNNIENILGHGILLDSGKKISIDVDYVLYLLGECCNESIGMNIKDIKIEKPSDDGNDTDEGRYSATGDSEKVYEYGVDVKAKNHSVPMQVIPQEKKVSIKGHKDSGLLEPSATDNSGHTT